MMYSVADNDLGIRIRRARESKRWSQKQLAAALGVGVRSVGSWERGEAEPRSSIGALERVLGVNLTGTYTDAYEDEYVRLDFDPGDPREALIASWTDVPVARRQEMIYELRAARRAARRNTA